MNNNPSPAGSIADCSFEEWHEVEIYASAYVRFEQDLIAAVDLEPLDSAFEPTMLREHLTDLENVLEVEARAFGEVDQAARLDVKDKLAEGLRLGHTVDLTPKEIHALLFGNPVNAALAFVLDRISRAGNVYTGRSKESAHLLGWTTGKREPVGNYDSIFHFYIDTLQQYKDESNPEWQEAHYAEEEKDFEQRIKEVWKRKPTNKEKKEAVLAVAHRFCFGTVEEPDTGAAFDALKMAVRLQRDQADTTERLAYLKKILPPNWKA